MGRLIRGLLISAGWAFRTDSTRFATLMLESEYSSGSEMWNYANYVLGY